MCIRDRVKRNGDHLETTGRKIKFQKPVAVATEESSGDDGSAASEPTDYDSAASQQKMADNSLERSDPNNKFIKNDMIAAFGKEPFLVGSSSEDDQDDEQRSDDNGANPAPAPARSRSRSRSPEPMVARRRSALDTAFAREDWELSLIHI